MLSILILFEDNESVIELYFDNTLSYYKTLNPNVFLIFFFRFESEF